MKYTNCLKIQPAEIGRARLVHDEPSRLERLTGAIHGQPLNRDKYCRLFVSGRLVMTDAEFERATNARFVSEAYGDVLVAGLGIGMILDPLLKACDSVTVIEKEPDVIALVGPYFPACRIIQADIFEWQPNGQRFDTIYFDVWSDFNKDIAKEGLKLERRFRKYLKPGGYIGNWARYAVEAMRRN